MPFQTTNKPMTEMDRAGNTAQSYSDFTCAPDVRKETPKDRVALTAECTSAPDCAPCVAPKA